MLLYSSCPSIVFGPMPLMSKERFAVLLLMWGVEIDRCFISGGSLWNERYVGVDPLRVS